MSKFRSKVVEIEAVLWNGAGFTIPLPQWIKEAACRDPGTKGSLVRSGDTLLIHTIEGVMKASPGDWIIQGTEGELYPCKPSVFQRKYEAIE